MTELVSLSLIYFAVIDPIGTIPIFLSLTEQYDYKQKQRIALRGCFVAFFVLIFFGFFGDLILSHLKISPDTFNIAGGAILFIIAVEMVNGRRQARKSRAATGSPNAAEELIRISSSPLAVPLLAGPGAITSIMVFGDFTTPDSSMLNLTAVFLALAVSAIILYLASWGSRFINLTISTVMSRLVGILLAAIAIQTILNGLNHLGIISL
ncbi:MAG: MarC family protein [Alphaproteobacteria bacterium]|jgi:multiple antibiotic resistance protein|nr:MarC family protein [Alphaproteobacteria bacterium]